MAKFELKFLDCYDENTIEIYEEDGVITIQTKEIFKDTIMESVCVCLDKSTAIKLSKTLRTEINKITESEVNNA